MFVPLQVAALDPVGNITLSLQVAILFLLVLGLPMIRGTGSKKSYQRHGYLTAIALILHTVLIFAVMVPSISNDMGDVASLSGWWAVTAWSHIVFGVAAEVMGAWLVGYWLAKSPNSMQCMKLKRLMWPTLIIWGLSVVNGALVHIFGII
jgi:hypothetical protein